MKALVTICIVAAALALAACGGAKQGSAPQPRATVTVTRPAAAATTPASSHAPSQPHARLTIQKAKAAYIRIVDPINRARGVVVSDVTDQVPFSQFLADNARQAAVTRKAGPQLSALRWPASVQPYVTAMVLTDLSAQLKCEQSIGATHSYTQMQAVASASQACTAAAQSTTNADQIRSLLGLPLLG